MNINHCCSMLPSVFKEADILFCVFLSISILQEGYEVCESGKFFLLVVTLKTKEQLEVVSHDAPLYSLRSHLAPQHMPWES
jgi:hypothetical protein